MNLRNTPTREFDFVLLLAALGLTVYGALLIYSGSLTTYGSPGQALSHPVSRQVVFAAIGLAAMVVLSRFDYRAFGPLSLTVYAVSIAMLVFVWAVGASAYGSRRWIILFGTQIQPSEIAKVTTVIMLAKYFSDNEEKMHSLRVFLTSMAIAGLPAALVLIEPDLGSALVFGVMWLGMALIAGVLLSMATVYYCVVRRPPNQAQRKLFEAFASREFAYLLVVLTLAGHLDWFLWLSVLGTYAFSIGLMALGRRPTTR
jgi:cell division protein FtsW (lipid II flippase)